MNTIGETLKEADCEKGSSLSSANEIPVCETSPDIEEEPESVQNENFEKSEK